MLAKTASFLGGTMDNQLEYVIGLTAFYPDGSKETFTVKQRDVDSEVARYSVWHEFKAIGEKLGVHYVTTRFSN